MNSNWHFVVSEWERALKAVQAYRESGKVPLDCWNSEIFHSLLIHTSLKPDSDRFVEGLEKWAQNYDRCTQSFALQAATVQPPASSVTVLVRIVRFLEDVAKLHQKRTLVESRRKGTARSKEKAEERRARVLKDYNRGIVDVDELHKLHPDVSKRTIRRYLKRDDDVDDGHV